MHCWYKIAKREKKTLEKSKKAKNWQYILQIESVAQFQRTYLPEPRLYKLRLWTVCSLTLLPCSLLSLFSPFTALSIHLSPHSLSCLACLRSVTAYANSANSMLLCHCSRDATFSTCGTSFLTLTAHVTSVEPLLTFQPWFHDLNHIEIPPEPAVVATGSVGGGDVGSWWQYPVGEKRGFDIEHGGNKGSTLPCILI